MITIVDAPRDGYRVEREIDELDPRPEHIRVRQYGPPEMLLPHGDVVVCQAGTATVLAALTGKPSSCCRSRPITTLWPSTWPMPARKRLPVFPAAAPVSCWRVRADPGCRSAAAWAGKDILDLPAVTEVVARLEELVAG